MPRSISSLLAPTPFWGINLLSATRLVAGTACFFAPAFFAKNVYGLTATKKVAFEGDAASTTTAPAPVVGGEDLTIAFRLSAARDIVLGLLLRDASPLVVLRGLQVSFISSLLDLGGAGLGFLEGNVTREVAIGIATLAGITAAIEGWLLSR